ncbi:MAG: PqqD family peptide modification chaperone [Acidobacteriia bacterium]|nr:PqqD family peptide modification chaperone [Terriglobia bacterium]
MNGGHPAGKRSWRLCGRVPANDAGAARGFTTTSRGRFAVVERRISPHTIVRAVNEQVFCELAGEATILNLKNGVYYGLDRVGSRIWSLLQQARRVQEIRDTLLEEYEVTAERCERDLLVLLEQLSAEGLIEIQDGSAA